MTDTPRILQWSDDEWLQATEVLQAGARAVDAAMAVIPPHARRLGELGWTMPVNEYPEFPVLLLYHVAPEDLDAAFLRLYAMDDGVRFAHLSRDLIGAPELRRWHPLLAQCLAAYVRGDYLVAVPALLAVYEGALAAVVDRPHDTRPRQLAGDELAAADRNLERILWASIDGFTTRLFGSSTFAGNPPPALNRHWVLHGRDEPRWGQADCLRLLQAVQTLGAARLLAKRDLSVLLRNPDLAALLKSLPPARPGDQGPPAAGVSAADPLS